MDLCIQQARRQCVDSGFTAKHSAGQGLVSTTFSSCKDDVEEYIGTMNGCIRERLLLGCDFPPWWLVSCFIANLEGNFGEFTQQVALRRDLPSFGDVSADLREVSRLQKRESEARAYRALAKKGAQSDGARKKGRKQCSFHKVTTHNDAQCWHLHPGLKPKDEDKNRVGGKGKGKGKSKDNKDKEKDKGKEKEDGSGVGSKASASFASGHQACSFDGDSEVEFATAHRASIHPIDGQPEGSSFGYAVALNAKAMQPSSSAAASANLITTATGLTVSVKDNWV
ncbi:MAG: hypothetical protein Q9203_007789, partial [Teloschistes exilis]